MTQQTVHVRRVYDEADAGESVRLLVDRVWPRGMRKDTGAFDEWVKDVAPSAELRTWYAHEVRRFAEFRRRYRAELDTPVGRRNVQELRDRSEGRPLTLLTATRDVEHSHAAVLAEVLRRAR
ncbi:DUF488 family protein [Lentzea sp. NEAU-D13]|uniref:DUF488 family protein n=1 Tax=Lentzea alba TaxID=2714351 RepID=A0A7C9RX76_9PSEU|nr:DUF488 family protein [Lentzea alba]NGY65109.1 DUF488 family protein [Lentzea alba]